jgi:predicted PurR-regulated permease PerM
MNADDNRDPPRILGNATIDFAIRLGIIGLLGYWSFRIIAPFLTIGMWSAILAVALYPLFHRLARRLGPRLAAALTTLLCLMVVMGPVTWLGVGMIAGISSLVASLDTPQLAVPLAPESVKSWPLVGERLHQLWSLAATNMKAALAEVIPMLKPVGATLLALAQSGFFALIELLASIVIAGFLFIRGPQMADALRAFLNRALSHRSNELVEIVGATIRKVSRGVIGIALLQSILAGAGFLAAGIPGAGVLAFVALLLGIIQIGPTILFIPIVVWAWMTMEAKYALIFTAYMIPVGLVDNILKPVLMARGLTTPMPVIMVGVIGGMMAYGIVGLFFGPIVLAVVWALMVTWVQEGEAIAEACRSGSEQAPTRALSPELPEAVRERERVP